MIFAKINLKKASQNVIFAKLINKNENENFQKLSNLGFLWIKSFTVPDLSAIEFSFATRTFPFNIELGLKWLGKVKPLQLTLSQAHLYWESWFVTVALTIKATMTCDEILVTGISTLVGISTLFEAFKYVIVCKHKGDCF